MYPGIQHPGVRKLYQAHLPERMNLVETWQISLAHLFIYFLMESLPLLAPKPRQWGDLFS
jgi:hypothetical protein